MKGNIKEMDNKKTKRKNGLTWNRDTVIFLILISIISALATSLFQIAGVIYSGLLQINIPITEASNILTVMRALGFISGIFGSKLAHQYSYRYVIFGGGFSLSTGLIFSSLVQSPGILFLTLGILVGIGIGFTLPPSTVLVGTYFSKGRSTALGITMSMAGAGSMLAPPFLQILLNEYGVHGALLLYGGIISHICACALLLRQPPSSYKKVPTITISDVSSDEQKITVIKELSNEKCWHQNSSGVGIKNKRENTDDNLLKNTIVERNLTSVIVSASQANNSNEAIVTTTENAENMVSDSYNNDKLVNNHIDLQIEIADPANELKEATKTNIEIHNKTLNTVSESQIEKLIENKAKDEKNPPLKSEKKEMSTSYAIETENEENPELVKISKMDKIILKEDERILYNIPPNQENMSEVSPNHSNVSFIIEFIADLIKDFRMFKESIFLILLLSRIGYFFTIVSIALILPEFAIENSSGTINNIQAAFLLSLFTLGSIIMRWVTGLWFDKTTKKQRAYAISLLIMGILTFCFQWAKTYIAFLICSALFGIASGSVFVISLAILFEMLGPTQAQGAHALLQATVGCCLLSTGVIIGEIRTTVGDYIHCWNILGSILIICSASWYFVPEKKKKKASES